MRRKGWRIALVVIAAVAVAFGAGVALLKVAVDRGVVSTYLAGAIEERLGRPVRVGHVGLSVFTGVSVKGLQIGNPPGFSPGPFMKAGRVQLKLKLLPLLTRKLIIDKVEVSGLEANIERNRQGLFNLRGETKRLDGSKAAGRGDPQRAPPFLVDVSSVTLRDGLIRITLWDKGVEKPLRIDLEHVRFDLSDLSSGVPAKLDMSFTLPGTRAPVLFKGRMPISEGSGEWVVRGSDVPLAILAGLLGTGPNVGSASFELKARSGPGFRSVAWSGPVSISGLDLGPTVGKVEGKVDHRGSVAIAGSIPVEVEIRDGSFKFTRFPALMPRVAARLIIDKGWFSVKALSVRLGRTSLEGSAGVTTANGGSAVTFRLSSPLLDLDELLAFRPVEEKRPAAARTAPPPAHRPGKGRGPMTVRGNLIAEEVRYRGLKISNAAVEVEIRDGTIVIPGLKAGFAGGRLTNQGRMDLGDGGPSYQARVVAEEIDARQVAALLLPSHSVLAGGSLYSEVSLSGRGAGLEGLRSGVARGDILISDGKLGGLDFLEKYRSVLRVEELRELAFRSFRLKFDMNGGVVQLQDAEFMSSLLRFKGRGGFDTSGRGLDADLTATFSPSILRHDLVSKVAGEFFQDSRGWITVPLKLRGKVEAPQVSVPREFLKRRMGEKLEEFLKRRDKGPRRGIGETLEKLLSK